MVLDDAAAMAGYLAELRHALHREPEVGLDLPRSQEKVVEALAGLPLSVTLGRRATSVTAVLRGGAVDPDDASRPVVLLRGDMDALPVQELADVPFRSRVDGVMHACGHDLHTTMLVGAAHLLCAQRDRLAGDVIFMFQPGEESLNGAGLMIEEGVLEAAGRPVVAALALHVFSGLLAHRQLVTRPGPIMASSDQLHVTVRGDGGHGSAPHLARDPIPVLAEMALALQTFVTRQFDIFDPVVVSVGLIHAGSKANVIPATGRLEATVRTFSEVSRERMTTGSVRLLQSIATGHGLDADVNFVPIYPATINDPREAAFVAVTIDELFGERRREPMPHPLPAAEDFSRVLAAVPGCFVGLGATPLDADFRSAPFNHSPDARYDDAVLPDGAALYAEWARRRLDLLQPSSDDDSAQLVTVSTIDGGLER
jgi:hippurate hydrolase